MKTVLKILGVLVLLVIVAAVSFYFYAFGGNAELKDGAELPGGARVVKDGFVAVFVLPTGDKTVALIDAGNDENGAAILAELKRRGSSPDDVKAIFLTHAHPDHMAGCHLFPHAEVMALGADVKLAAGEERGKGFLPSKMDIPVEKRCKVTHELSDGETVGVGSLNVKVYATPGHTGGSATYLAGDVLYLGDNARIASDGSIKAAPGAFSDDPMQNRNSLVSLAQKLKAEGASVKKLAPAHTGQADGLDALVAFKAQ
jgi:glyoxylase-like metal-dependent hydrolase (beta-lactamase superfamily II)